MNKEIEYEINNTAYDEYLTKDDGGGIKCKNYQVCNTLLPLWWFNNNNNYLCTNCQIMFGDWGIISGKGILKIIDNIDCPICLEYNKGISQPRCEHYICIECFKRCYFSEENNHDIEPIFPYSDIEDEYFNDNLNPKWEKDYPLITIYNEEYDKWEERCDQKYDSEEYLRSCPLCRK